MNEQQRPLRFRGWDPREGEMFYLPDYICGLYWFEENSVRQVPDDLRPGVFVMQSTGLHDAEGTEVYEGDVLETWDEEDGEHYRSPVGFADGAFRTVYEDGEACEDPLSEWLRLCPDARVIGNVYASPSLLAPEPPRP